MYYLVRKKQEQELTMLSKTMMLISEKIMRYSLCFHVLCSILAFYVF